MNYNLPLYAKPINTINIETFVSFCLIPADGPIYDERGYASTAISSNYVHDNSAGGGMIDFTYTAELLGITYTDAVETKTDAVNIYYRRAQ